MKLEDVKLYVLDSDYSTDTEKTYETYFIRTDGGWVKRVSDGTDYKMLPPMSITPYWLVESKNCVGLEKVLAKYDLATLPSGNDHATGGIEIVKVLVDKT